MDDLVKIKGDNNNIVISLNDEAPFDAVVNALFSMLLEALPLLSSNKIVVNLGNRRHLNPYVDNLIQKFEKLNLNLSSIVIDVKNEKKDASLLNSKFFSEKNRPMTLIKRTVRSGQRILSEGDLIIFGDVNPGGEVSATGNIIVLGEVRGVVHAGIKGDIDKYIIAYTLNPLQIRIGPYIIRGENLLQKIKEDMSQKVKIIYLDNGEFKISSDFSILREVPNVS